jgi:hypothetical protein
LGDDQLHSLLGEDVSAMESRRAAAHKLKLLRKARDEVNAALL